jgi:murein DD-endopeptidase MepM/ murein hydrolase activator NlpD
MKRFPRWHAIGVAALTFVMLSVAMWPAPSQSVVVELPPKIVAAPVTTTEIANAQVEPEFTRIAEEVQPGDTLSTVFERANAGVRVLYRMLAIDDISDPLERIYPGQSFEFEFDNDNLLHTVTFSESILIKHRISLTEDGFDIEKIVREPEIHTRFAEATIDSSLYLSAKEAGLSDNMIMQMATLYGWDIDFALDIRAGDTFSLIYQEEYLDGQKLSDGPILVARFVNQGREVNALRYTDEGGRTDYYSPNGDSMRKAFLRTPMDVFRISSGFNPNRRHPVLNTIRAHKGTDYAAPTGTPIKVTGEGKVVSAGRNGGYGNVVVVQHGGGIRTLYAHMSQFSKNARVGNRVRQGQIIGYVGATGQVTGPHLHYEFLVNGVHKNPQTVDLPTAQPLDSRFLPNFEEFASNMMGQLSVFEETYVAVE